jgi:hypothetical protein
MSPRPVPLPIRQQRYTQNRSSSCRDGCASSNSPGISTYDKSSLDFTQRIERKLAEYNASQSLFKRWLFEILSWCVSALCMAAVVGIYVRLKDEPLYGPFSGLLLNLANVFGKVASAALIVPTSEALGQLKWDWFQNSKAMWDFEIFDKASRGPWGAVVLLFRTKGRSLAALGALLIVLLLAIDSFFQQVVDMPDRWTLVNQDGNIPVAIQYQPGLPKVYRDGVEMNMDDKYLALVVEKFAYGNGTQPIPFGNGTRPEIPLVSTRPVLYPVYSVYTSVLTDILNTTNCSHCAQSCPTSNCTWPAYDTLGICSQCDDVSTQLTYACLNSTVDWTADLQGGYAAEKSYVKATACGYFLNATSQHPTLMSGYLVNVDGTPGETLMTRVFPLTTIFDFIPFYGNGSIKFRNLRNTIADVLIVSATNGSASSVRNGKPPVAQECVLAWCVKRIHSTYMAGLYNEDILHNFHNTTEGAFPWTSVPFQTADMNGTDNNYLQNISINLGPSLGGRNISEYGTSNYSASSIYQGFQDVFPSFTTVKDEFPVPVMRWKTWQKGSASSRVLDFNPWLAPNNVTRHMERLATAMTNVIRSAPGNTMISGGAFRTETYISVHWGWLAFPFILLSLSLVFLVATMLKTSKNGEIGIWKTSAMPTLIYSLPQDVQKELTLSKADDSASRKGARKVRIKLLPDQGWRVSRRLCASPKTRKDHPNGPPGWI